MKHPITYFTPIIDKGKLRWRKPDKSGTISDWQHDLVIKFRKKYNHRWRSEMREFKDYLNNLKRGLK